MCLSFWKPRVCACSTKTSAPHNNTLRTVWGQSRNPTVFCFFLSSTSTSLNTSCAYILHALLLCLSIFLGVSFWLLLWVDDLCKDCSIWQDLPPMLASAFIFSDFSFLKNAVFAHLWGFLPVLLLLSFLHPYTLALFCWAFQSFQFLFSLEPMILNLPQYLYLLFIVAALNVHVHALSHC